MGKRQQQPLVCEMTNRRGADSEQYDPKGSQELSENEAEDGRVAQWGNGGKIKLWPHFNARGSNGGSTGGCSMENKSKPEAKSLSRREAYAVGQAFRLVRLGRGDTQHDIAEYLNVDQATVSRFERGRSPLTPILLRKWARKYNISCHEVIARAIELAKSDVKATLEQLLDKEADNDLRFLSQN